MSREAAAQGSAGAGGGSDADTGGDLGGFDDANDTGLLGAFEESLEADEEASADYDRQPKQKGRRGQSDNDQDDDDAGDDDGDDQDADDDQDDDDDNDEDENSAGNKKAKGKDDADDDGDDQDGDFVELEDGTKFAVRELLDAHKYKQEVNATVDQVRADLTQRGEQELTEFKTAATAKIKDLEDGIALIEALVPKLEKPPASMLDPASDDYDPDGYHFLMRAYDEFTTKLNAAKDKLGKGKGVTGKIDQAARKREVDNHLRQLLEKAPDLKDEKKAKAFTADLRKFLKGDKFSDDEINGLIDHRMILIVRDAMAHRQAKAKGPPKVEKGKTPRLVRGRRANAPGKGKGGRSNKGNADALTRLHRTGRVADSDLEAVFGDFLG